MADIYDRFKTLRKTKKLSQTEFGERVGVSRSVITNIEYKLVEPKELLIKQVCKEYRVNYLWLTKGKGDMFDESEDMLLDELAEEYKLDELDKKIVEVYIKLSHQERMELKRILKKIFENE
ncbi:MAG: helix-turn-helix transcriptional regulator [Acutalibacteraceae bacterium]